MKKNVILLLTLLCLLKAKPAQALLLDDYSSTNTISIGSDTGASASVTNIAGEDGNALQLSYSLGTGNWSQFYRDYSTRDFASEGGTAVRFRTKATGNSNTLEIKFADYDSTETAKSDKLSLKLVTIPDNQWRTYTVHFSSFDVFPDGGSAFDLNKVAKLSIGVTKDSGSSGSGTVWIDKFELLRSTVIVIDDFQSSASNLNFLNGTSTQTFAGGGGTATTQYSALGADNVLELNYNVNAGGSFSGMFFGLRGRTFQGYTHLSFRIRGGAGGEKILAKLESPTGSTELGFTTTPYLTNGITTSFQTVTIPLSAFPNVNLSSVTAFTFVATQSTGSAAGQIFLDDIKFLRQGDSAGVLRVIDDMDMDLPSSNFEANSHANASLQTSVVSDATVPEAKSDNRVYKLEYTFRNSGVGDTPWVVIERPLFHSIAPFSNFKVRDRRTTWNLN
ncbi:MAG: hypothetical protein HYY63_04065 [Elusimicrobia bacterium]|nr:hypothetical protein [Elusimicrobiota bacterium]